MAQVKFGLYTIAVHDKAAKGLRTIDDVVDGKSLFDLVLEALEPYTTANLVEELQSGGGRATSIARLDADPAKAVLHGVGYFGTFGTSSRLLDVVDDTKMDRTKTQADQAPYYFHFDLSGGYTEGVLLFQYTSGRSLKTAFDRVLRRYIQEGFDGLTVRIHECVPGDVLRALAQKGTINTVIVEKKEVSADRVVQGVNTAAPGKLRLEFAVKGGGSAWKQSLGLTGTGPVVVTMGDGLSLLDGYDRLKIDVDIGGGQTKRIDLGSFGKPQPYVIPDQSKIAIEDDGNPRIADIHALAIEDVRYVREAIQGRS